MEERGVDDRFRTVGDSSRLSHSDKLYKEEAQLASRNRGMPLEGLRYAITSTGMHYLLIHFDIPYVNAVDWRLEIAGLVSRPLSLTLEELKKRPAQSLPVTMECAGNGRAPIPFVSGRPTLKIIYSRLKRSGILAAMAIT